MAGRRQATVELKRIAIALVCFAEAGLLGFVLSKLFRRENENSIGSASSLGGYKPVEAERTIDSQPLNHHNCDVHPGERIDRNSFNSFNSLRVMVLPAEGSCVVAIPIAASRMTIAKGGFTSGCQASAGGWGVCPKASQH